MTSFGSRLAAAVDARGPLCVGIDPHASLLDVWGLPASAAGVREFGLRVVDAARTRVGVVKPQVAFFERYGSAGFVALEEVIGTARAAGLVVIAVEPRTAFTAVDLAAMSSAALPPVVTVPPGMPANASAVSAWSPTLPEMTSTVPFAPMRSSAGPLAIA